MSLCPFVSHSRALHLASVLKAEPRALTDEGASELADYVYAMVERAQRLSAACGDHRAREPFAQVYDEALGG